MCSAPDAPKPPVAAPPPAKQDIVNDEAVKTASFNERERLAKMAGRKSTVLTGGSDLGTAITTRKTLLGQ